MRRLNDNGASGGLFVATLLMTILFVAATGFGLWAFMGRSDYKNNVDKKIAAAVEAENQRVSTEKDNQFMEREKSPLKSYTGPESQGSLSFEYPKTWSSLVSETLTTGAGIPIDGFFYPNYLPGINLPKVSYALRVQVLAQAYDAVLNTFNGSVQSGTVRANPYRLPKVPSTLGTKLEGRVSADKEGAMIILPLRDKTIKIWTEANQFLGDFNDSILPSMTFVP